MKSHPLCLLITLLGAICTAGAQVPCVAWDRLTDADAAAAGWSRKKLAEARDWSKSIHTEAVVIVHQGRVLESWGAIDRNLNVRSIRKSFLSALCGIEADAGRLDIDRSLADLGIDDCPPALSDGEKRATVRQLLQARSGVYHPALYETERMKELRPARESHQPGTFWYYNNWDFNALGTIYEKAAGGSIFASFQRHIAAPIGMEDFKVGECQYFKGEDSIHPAYLFYISARDLARFGLLYLRGGRWGDTQVIPEAWVKESLQSYSDAELNGGYGYLWWTAKGGLHFPGVTLPEGSYSARGKGGNYLLVIPQLDLVISHRVDADGGRNVAASEFGQLLQRILAAYQPPPVRKPTAAALDTLLPLLMTKHHVPGVAVIGIENRRIAWEKYAGVRTAGEPARVDDQTIFEAASMSKPICAYAALKLVEQGKLDLDRPLTGYLPEPYLPDQPLHKKITARMVLHHTTGFPNWRPKGGTLRVLHEPGTKFGYSGEGYKLLQTAIEAIIGEPYEDYIQRTLLRPLGMKHSSHVWRERYAASAAAGHDDRGEVKKDRRLYSEANAAYSLYCTPRDYAAFILDMLNPDRSAPHSINADSIRAMITPSGPASGKGRLSRRGTKGKGTTHFGAGWSVAPTASGPRPMHSGSNGTGFRSHVEFDPKKGHGLIIMTNSISGADLWRELVSYIGQP